MLLKVGIASMLFAVALAAVIAVAVSLSGSELASSETAVEPLANGAPAEQEREFDPGEKLEIDDEPPAKPSEEPETLPVSSEDWPRPSREEVATVEAPRYYPPRRDAKMTLTIGAIGIYDAPVINSNSREALDNGVIHLPETPMPWEERKQKNVYLAGHRLGYPGTGSRLIFYNLDKLSKGDYVVLKDSSGNTYKYRVSEVFVVEPEADWVVDPVRNRDMVTLQTCTYPDLENRIIVRADRV